MRQNKKGAAPYSNAALESPDASGGNQASSPPSRGRGEILSFYSSCATRSLSSQRPGINPLPDRRSSLAAGRNPGKPRKGNRDSFVRRPHGRSQSPSAVISRKPQAPSRQPAPSSLEAGAQDLAAQPMKTMPAPRSCARGRGQCGRADVARPKSRKRKSVGHHHAQAAVEGEESSRKMIGRGH